jgi:hypothetical protein
MCTAALPAIGGMEASFFPTADRPEAPTIDDRAGPIALVRGVEDQDEKLDEVAQQLTQVADRVTTPETASAEETAVRPAAAKR